MGGTEEVWRWMTKRICNTQGHFSVMAKSTKVISVLQRPILAFSLLYAEMETLFGRFPFRVMVPRRLRKTIFPERRN